MKTCKKQRILQINAVAEPVENVSLVRVRPEHNQWRFYRMEVWPDLFGGALLVRHWGRIGTEGRRRIDPHPDHRAALTAVASLAATKRRRGYCDRGL
jgi:predicted DNA-binding WGR domain protein